MGFMVYDVGGQSIVEGTPGVQLLMQVKDTTLLLEECFSNATRLLLLYPENLTARFFDLRSREAGEILQKLRQYRIRFALVYSPDIQLSNRFREFLVDEAGGRDFGLFPDRAAAHAWLAAD